MTQSPRGAFGAARRDAIEAALAHYPHLSRESLADVIAWFRKEASAHDVAMVACNADIAEPYRRFRADHIDPLTAKDWMKGLLFAAVVGGIVLAILWRAF